jgi:hypothetical protein
LVHLTERNTLKVWVRLQRTACGDTLINRLSMPKRL